MRELAVEMPEYVDEKEGEHKKDNGTVAFYMLGAAILAVGILCAILLWRKTPDGAKPEFSAETYQEEYTEDSAVRQQYMTDVENLKEKVESMLLSMTETKEALESAAEFRETNSVFQEQADTIASNVGILTERLEDTQTRILEIEESISVMNSETIVAIEENLGDIEKQISAINVDISDIYVKADSLTKADTELQSKMEEIERNLKTSAEQNMTNVTNQFDSMNDKMQQMDGSTQSKIQQLSGDMQTEITNIQTQINNMQNGVHQIESQMLQYNYEPESDTLYLYSN